MIGDVIDTFRNTTPAGNQELIRIGKIETNARHGVPFSRK